MTKLKIDISFNSSCILTTKDTTGFGGATGFISEVATPTTEGEYKISDGWFINALLYHRYIGSPQIINTNEQYLHIEADDVSTTYANNFSTKNYTLQKDGVYTFKRLFFISKAYYLANADDITKTVIYYDDVENIFVKVDNDVETTLTYAEAISAINITTTGSFVTYKFVSTCYLNKCLYLLQNEIFNNGIAACSSGDVFKKQRDFLTMTLNIIKYLKEDGHLTEVQKLIETTDSCGMVCKYIGTQNNTDCGCG